MRCEDGDHAWEDCVDQTGATATRNGRPVQYCRRCQWFRSHDLLENGLTAVVMESGPPPGFLDAGYRE